MFVRFVNNRGQQTAFGFTAQFDFKPTGLDPRDVEVKTLEELKQKFADYCAEADATGLALVVTFHQPNRDRSRKINGFATLSAATKHHSRRQAPRSGVILGQTPRVRRDERNRPGVG